MEVTTYNEQSARLRRETLNRYRFDESVGQILMVSHTVGSEAIARLYCKQEAENCWTLVFETDAHIGRNGVGKTREGDAKTPLGDYGIRSAFGILPDPGTNLEYITVQPTTFACDEEGAFYNQIIDTRETGHACHGEEMYLYSPDYNYGLATDYNPDNEYPKGSAIFVHCKGVNPYTAGCVALDEDKMKTVLLRAETGMRVYVDELYN
ncbi:MAG: L,D-transpeptidase family protein [Lachnospiraceae bacterium]|nr:L,D-transpeptidase family protein [Lachnospiraceae bacterium]